MGNTKKEIHQSVYIWCLVLLGIAMPVSRFLMSVSLLCLSFNWLLEGGFKRKTKILLSRKSILLILSVYFLHVIGLIYSVDYRYGFHDLKIKLPLLVLTIITGTSEKIPVKKMKIILLFFIATVLTATLISTSIYIYTLSEMPDTRKLSPFISHIRFSLMVDMAILIILYMMLFKGFKLTGREKIILSVVALWLTCFLLILQSFTGIWIFLITVPVLLIYWLIRQKKKLLTMGISTLLILSILVIIATFYRAFGKFYPQRVINIESLDKYTVNGNLYSHNTESDILENGNYIYLYICLDELRREWNARSNIEFDSLDRKGQHLSQTLVRYLASKGLRKDSAGVAALSQQDIKMIENGFSNHIFIRKFSIYPRIYQFFWEIDVYRKTGNPGGHSLTQRIEFQKNGIEIIKRNFWIGVGTGDVKTEFNHQYKISDSHLDEKWRHRAHNQLLTFFITFGALGFAWILFAFSYSVWYEKKHKDILTLIFLLVAFLSMLNEDTLETLAGICFFSFFFTLFVFAYDKKTAD